MTNAMLAKPVASTLKVIFVGRLIYAKGVGDLLKVCNGLWDRYDFDLAIVGDGVYRPDLEAMVRNSCADRVRFRGELSHREVMTSLAESDIFVNPSYSEGLPTSVLEAAVVGLPIVATDVGGTKEIIEHGVSGLLYKPHDTSWLEIHLKTLLDTPALRSSFGKKAHQEAARFSWDRITQQYLDLFEEVKR